MKHAALSIIALSLGLLLSSNAYSEDAKKQAPVDKAEANEEVIVIQSHVAPVEKKKLSDRNCIRYTGTHLSKREKGKCTGAVGRSYDREDIERTGAVDVGQALERLDPSVTIRRY